MELGFSGDSFGNLLILLISIVLIVVAVIYYVAHRKGIDVTKRAFQLKLGLSGAIIAVIIPLCLTDMSIMEKIIGSIISLSVGIGNYFAIDRMQNILGERFRNKKSNLKGNNES